MFWNLLIAAIGIMVCFSGLRLRKPCSVVLGLFWGGIIALLALTLVDAKLDLTELNYIFPAVVAVGFAILFWFKPDAADVVASFMVPFFIITILMVALTSLANMPILFVSIIASLLISAYTPRSRSFLIASALFGGLFAALGIGGIVLHQASWSILFDLLFGEKLAISILLFAILGGVLGTCVQWNSAPAIEEE